MIVFSVFVTIALQRSSYRHNYVLICDNTAYHGANISVDVIAKIDIPECVAHIICQVNGRVIQVPLFRRGAVKTSCIKATA